jgi:hypothetical protein
VKGTHVAVCALAVAAAVPCGRAGEASSDTYLLSLGETTHALNIDLKQLVRIRKGQTGDFLWFRQGGRAYVVTDAGVLAAGRDIVRPVWDLGGEQELVSARLSPFEEREQALDRDEERLDERLDHLAGRDDRAASEERRRLEIWQRELEARRRALAADTREIEVDERRLEDREREVERVADTGIARLIEDALRRGLARPLPDRAPR